MGAFIDLTGKKFGLLTVIGLADKKYIKSCPSGKIMWDCLCECGKHTFVSSGNLKRGGTKSCGCLKTEMQKPKDLTGKTFGRLTVIEFADRVYNNRGINGRIRWKCLCECGEIIFVRGESLTCGKTKSCGCIIKEMSKESIKKAHLANRTESHMENGYIVLHNIDHPNANSFRHIREHIYIMSKIIKRPLNTKTEFVHHKNGIRSDNRIENLELWTKTHPSGQRVKDMVLFCRDYLEKYEPLLACQGE